MLFVVATIFDNAGLVHEKYISFKYTMTILLVWLKENYKRLWDHVSGMCGLLWGMDSPPLKKQHLRALQNLPRTPQRKPQKYHYEELNAVTLSHLLIVFSSPCLLIFSCQVPDFCSAPDSCPKANKSIRGAPNLPSQTFLHHIQVRQNLHHVFNYCWSYYAICALPFYLS